MAEVQSIAEIDLVRAVLEHSCNDTTNYFFMSLFMEIDETSTRNVEALGELLGTQNRSDKTLMLVTSESDNDIWNIKSEHIVPMDFTVRARCPQDSTLTLSKKVSAIITDLKGKKKDVARLADDTIQVFETPSTAIVSGAYIGTVTSANNDTRIKANITALTTLGLTNSLVNGSIVYYQYGTALFSATFDGTNFTPSSSLSATFTKYKVSLAFSTLKFSEIYSEGGVYYADFSVNGRASIVGSNVLLGNDMTKVSMTLDSGTTVYEIDPVSFSSATELADLSYQTYASGMMKQLQNTSTDTKIQYAIIVSLDNKLSMNIWHLARYGTPLASGDSDLISDFDENVVYNVTETYAYFGIVKQRTYKAKIKSPSTSNTESDVISVSFTMDIIKG